MAKGIVLPFGSNGEGLNAQPWSELKPAQKLTQLAWNYNALLKRVGAIEGRLIRVEAAQAQATDQVHWIAGLADLLQRHCEQTGLEADVVAALREAVEEQRWQTRQVLDRGASPSEALPSLGLEIMGQRPRGGE